MSLSTKKRNSLGDIENRWAVTKGEKPEGAMPPCWGIESWSPV